VSFGVAVLEVNVLENQPRKRNRLPHDPECV
jgi:hypothetical protein